MQYLVEKYAKDDSLYPKDPKKRGIVDQRLYFDIGTLYDNIGTCFVSFVLCFSFVRSFPYVSFSF